MLTVGLRVKISDFANNFQTQFLAGCGAWWNYYDYPMTSILLPAIETSTLRAPNGLAVWMSTCGVE